MMFYRPKYFTGFAERRCGRRRSTRSVRAARPTSGVWTALAAATGAPGARPAPTRRARRRPRSRVLCPRRNRPSRCRAHKRTRRRQSPPPARNRALSPRTTGRPEYQWGRRAGQGSGPSGAVRGPATNSTSSPAPAPTQSPHTTHSFTYSSADLKRTGSFSTLSTLFFKCNGLSPALCAVLYTFLHTPYSLLQQHSFVQS